MDLDLRPWKILAIAILLATASAISAAAEDDAGENAAVAALRAEIAALRHDYEARISALEARLAELAAGSPPAAGPAAAAPAVPSPGDELARLRAAAASQVAAAPPAERPASAPGASEGRRSLSALNPEISFTGLVLASASDANREEFSLQEFELDLQSALDPFSRTHFTISVGDQVDIEEGYITYTSLPGGLSLSAGKFRQQFGVLNRQHLHALPQNEYPLALATYFTDEGLAQTGVSLRWLLPRSWATASELTLEVTSGDSEAFGGDLFQHLVTLAHVKSFWETGPSTYLEWGLSGVVGDTGDGGDRRVWGSDFTLHWQPPQRAKYRELTWRTEALLSRRDDAFGVEQEAWGGYSYLDALVAQNLYLGVRYDWVEDPLEPSRRTQAVVPYLSWWESEFVRLRGEYQRLETDGQGASNRFVLQITWAAGPHKHESY